jgi:hypothetical protein
MNGTLHIPEKKLSTRVQVAILTCQFLKVEDFTDNLHFDDHFGHPDMPLHLADVKNTDLEYMAKDNMTKEGKQTDRTGATILDISSEYVDMYIVLDEPLTADRLVNGGRLD